MIRITVERNNSWSYKFFSIISCDGPDISWFRYYTTVAVGFSLAATAIWAVIFKFLPFIREELISRPELTMPTLYVSGLSLSLVFLNSALRNFAFYKQIMSWLFPPVTFVD